LQDLAGFSLPDSDAGMWIERRRAAADPSSVEENRELIRFVVRAASSIFEAERV